MRETFLSEHFAVNSSGVVTLRRPLSDVTDAMVTVTVKVADARGLETVDPVIITVSIDSKYRTLPPMPFYDTICIGVTKLLEGLNPSKALGPNELHPRVLKELASELRHG